LPFKCNLQRYTKAPKAPRKSRGGNPLSTYAQQQQQQLEAPQEVDVERLMREEDAAYAQARIEKMANNLEVERRRASELAVKQAEKSERERKKEARGGTSSRIQLTHSLKPPGPVSTLEPMKWGNLVSKLALQIQLVNATRRRTRAKSRRRRNARRRTGRRRSARISCAKIASSGNAPSAAS
jgi:hypothetical protein